jgi:hypothetical protein
MEHPKSPIGKTKVGRSIKSLNVPTSLSEQEMLVVVDKIISNPFITYSHSMCEQYLLDWSVEDDSYLSWFEKSQLEYDGEILFPEPIIEYGETLTYKEEMNV